MAFISRLAAALFSGRPVEESQDGTVTVQMENGVRLKLAQVPWPLHPMASAKVEGATGLPIMFDPLDLKEIRAAITAALEEATTLET
jgi:hypothetical protein